MMYENSFMSKFQGINSLQLPLVHSNNLLSLRRIACYTQNHKTRPKSSQNRILI